MQSFTSTTSIGGVAIKLQNGFPESNQRTKPHPRERNSPALHKRLFSPGSLIRTLCRHANIPSRMGFLP